VPQFVTDDGVQLEYEVWGDGETTLLHLPGWISSIELMRWIEPLTSDGIRAAAYELRGTGRSDRPTPSPDNYSIERLAADAIGVADSLQPCRLVVLAGFEAAHHAVRLATARPEEVTGLVLTQPLLAPVADRPMQVMWERMIARGINYALRSVADLVFANLPEEERQRFARSLEGHVDSEVLLAMWRSIDVTDSRDFLDRITCPACVISGTLDLAIPLEWSARVAERLPKGRLVRIEGAGSAIAATNPGQALGAIQDFIRGL
jgi:pimeloyl-ACP methyl ester carboxylesterase